MAAILKHVSTDPCKTSITVQFQAHMTSPGDDGERKTVMFLTPSPGSSQTSGPGASSQDEKWSSQVAGADTEENWGQKGLLGQEQAVGRERWSPPAKLDPPPLPPPISVDRLDFSVRKWHPPLLLGPLRLTLWAL